MGRRRPAAEPAFGTPIATGLQPGSGSVPSAPPAIDSLPGSMLACEGGGLFTLCMAIAGIALALAMQVRDGLIEPTAVALLFVAVIACIAAFGLPGLLEADLISDRPILVAVVCGLALEFHQLIYKDLPGSWHGVDMNWQFRTSLVCAAALAAALVILPRHWKLIFYLLLGTFLLQGIWIIRNVPEPYMDVWMLQTQTLRKFLLHGANPYSAVYPDVYDRPQLYAPGAIVDGLVHQGFPYPPVAVWMSLAGYAVFTDYRYGNLLAMAGAALLIARSRPTRLAPLAGALFLFTPRVFFVLESGWTEPQSVVLLAAAAFFACRAMAPQRAIPVEASGGTPPAAQQSPPSSPLPAGVAPIRRLDYARPVESLIATAPVPVMPPRTAWTWLAILLGLFVASKQYLIFAAPIAVLLLGRRPTWRGAVRPVVIATVAAVLVSAPLVLWDYAAFVKATTGVAAAAEFRTDALNFTAWAANVTGSAPSAVLASYCGISAALLGIALALRCGPRSPAGYCAAFALVYFLFFAFYKFAFCNYYYLIFAACCCAIGTRYDPPGEHTPETRPA